MRADLHRIRPHPEPLNCIHRQLTPMDITLHSAGEQHLRTDPARSNKISNHPRVTTTRVDLRDNIQIQILPFPPANIVTQNLIPDHLTSFITTPPTDRQTLHRRVHREHFLHPVDHRAQSDASRIIESITHLSKNSVTPTQTRSTSSSVRLGNIGKLKAVSARRSVIGNSPATFPR